MHIFTTFTREIPRRMPQLIGLGFHHQRCTGPNSNTNTNTKLHILKQRRYSYGSSTPLLVVKNTSDMIHTKYKVPWDTSSLADTTVDWSRLLHSTRWTSGWYCVWASAWVLMARSDVEWGVSFARRQRGGRWLTSPHSRQLLLLCWSPCSSSSFSLLIIISTHGSKSTMSMQIRNKSNSPITQRWLTQIASERKLSGEQLQGFPLRGSRRKRGQQQKYLVERKTSRAAGFPTPPKSLPLKLILTQLLPLGKWRR